MEKPNTVISFEGKDVDLLEVRKIFCSGLGFQKKNPKGEPSFYIQLKDDNYIDFDPKSFEEAEGMFVKFQEILFDPERTKAYNAWCEAEGIEKPKPEPSHSRVFQSGDGKWSMELWFTRPDGTTGWNSGGGVDTKDEIVEIWLRALRDAVDSGKTPLINPAKIGFDLSEHGVEIEQIKIH